MDDKIRNALRKVIEEGPTFANTLHLHLLTKRTTTNLSKAVYRISGEVYSKFYLSKEEAIEALGNVLRSDIEWARTNMEDDLDGYEYVTANEVLDKVAEALNQGANEKAAIIYEQSCQDAPWIFDMLFLPKNIEIAGYLA